jgi:hypothetical protein
MSEKIRGVFEHETFPGQRSFSIRSADGTCLRIVTDPEERVTPDSIDALWQFLDAQDPERLKIELVKAGVQTGVRATKRREQDAAKPLPALSIA